MNVDIPTPWSGLVEQRPMLVRVLKRRCADRSIAEDLAHDTLLRAARYRPRDLEEGRLPAWLQRIALNVLNDHLRRECRGPKPETRGEEVLGEVEGRELPPGEDRHSETLYRTGSATLVREEALHHAVIGLQRLSDRDRRLIAVACSDVSEEPGEPRKQRKGRLFRARRRLRRAVERSVLVAEHPNAWCVGGRS